MAKSKEEVQLAAQKLKEWSLWMRERDDPKIRREKPEALDDLVVLDLSYANGAGLYCSSLLAEWGAMTIRIEPSEGDFARTFAPHGATIKDTGIAYVAEARNKHHITLNLENPEARELLKGLVAQADVLIETFKAGTMDDWGIGYEELKKINPRLIYCSIYTYGQFGPESHLGLPSYENIDEALCGVQYANGEMLPKGKTMEECPYAVPTRYGYWDAWYLAGAQAVQGIMAAMHYREKTGEGQAIDISPAETFTPLLNYDIIRYDTRGIVSERFGNYDLAVWIYGFFPSTDGGVCLACVSLRLWHALADAMGKWDQWGPEHHKDVLDLLPVEKQLEVYQSPGGVEDWTSKHSAQEIVDISVDYALHGRLAPTTWVVGKINKLQDTLDWDNWWERGVFERVEDTEYGEILMVNNPFKMTETPARIKWVCRPVGADNEFVYKNYLGMGPTEVEELKNQGVI
jgi:crotonobetainyl-CoA:carnitine CoA-transferase CaiB-like acyl-CoA transferase